MLGTELRADGHDVLARNRVDHGAQDPVLGHLDELGFDQLWLMAVDVGNGLTPDECGDRQAPRARWRVLATWLQPAAHY